MFDKDVELLKEYNNWVAQKKITEHDYSPEAFLVDRAKDQALQKLIRIDQYIETDPFDAYNKDEERVLAVGYSEIRTILDA